MGTAADSTLTTVNGRHAFVHERLLELIARETEAHGFAKFTKRELAATLGCCQRSIDRAITRLKRSGRIEVLPRYGANGAQEASWYRAIVPDGQQTPPS